MITQAVLQHVKHKTFLLCELRRDEELKRNCLEQAKKNCDCTWAASEITCELDSIISNLPQDGHVIPTNPARVLTGRAYEASNSIPIFVINYYGSFLIRTDSFRRETFIPSNN